jgi:hypothetical protein
VLLRQGCTGNEGPEHNAAAREAGQDLVLGKPRHKGWEEDVRRLLSQRA